MNTLLLFTFTLGVAMPVHALMGEDYALFSAHHQLGAKARQAIPIEKIKRFTKVRKTTRPNFIRYYTNDQGRINKEYWEADMDLWSFKEAHAIRNLIMSGFDTLKGQTVDDLKVVYYYSKGSKVIYKRAKGGVFSILAYDKDYDPGNLGRTPGWFSPKMLSPRPVLPRPRPSFKPQPKAP